MNLQEFAEKYVNRKIKFEDKYTGFKGMGIIVGYTIADKKEGIYNCVIVKIKNKNKGWNRSINDLYDVFIGDISDSDNFWYVNIEEIIKIYKKDR